MTSNEHRHTSTPQSASVLSTLRSLRFDIMHTYTHVRQTNTCPSCKWTTLHTCNAIHNWGKGTTRWRPRNQDGGSCTTAKMDHCNARHHFASSRHTRCMVRRCHLWQHSHVGHKQTCCEFHKHFHIVLHSLHCLKFSSHS